jgi:hypothetical protein
VREDQIDLRVTLHRRLTSLRSDIDRR